MSYLIAMSLFTISGLDLVTILAAAESPTTSTVQLAKAVKYKVKRKINFPVSQITGRENT